LIWWAAFIMSYAPRTLIKSRGVLQSLKGGDELKKYEAFDRILQQIWLDVRQGAIGGRTTYVYDYNRFIQDNREFKNLERFNMFRLDLVTILEKEYPECSIKYVETVGYGGEVVQRIIVIDWS